LLPKVEQNSKTQGKAAWLSQRKKLQRQKVEAEERQLGLYDNQLGVSASAADLSKGLIGFALIAVGTPEDRSLTLIKNCEHIHGFTKRLIKG